MRTARHGILYHVTMFLLLLLVAAYLLLPEAISYGLQHWLRAQGFVDAAVTDVDAEPFGGELRVEGLQGHRGDGPLLALKEGYLNIDWLALARHRGVLQGLALQGVELTISQDSEGRVSVSGLPLPAGGQSGDDGQPWGMGLERLTISDSLLHLRLQGLHQTLTIEKLSLTGLRSWASDTPAQLSLNARLDGAHIRIDGDLLPFTANPMAKLRARVAQLDLGKLADGLAEQLPASRQLKAGTLDLDMELDVQLTNATPTIDQRGQITVHGLRLALPDAPLAQQIDKLHWQGRLHWSGERGLATDGELDLVDLRLAHGGRMLIAGGLAWRGQAGWREPDGARADGGLHGSALTITQPEQQLLLAAIERLDIPALRLDRDLTLRIEGLELAQPRLLGLLDPPDQAPLLQAGRISIGASRIQGDQSLALGPVGITDTVVNLTLADDGKVPQIARLQGAPASSAEAGTDGATTPALALAGLNLLNPARIDIEDRRAKPPFRQTLTIDKLDIGALDSQAAGNWTPVQFAGRAGEYSRFSAQGQVKPFTDKLNLQLSATIKSLDLQQLSAYTAGKLGQNVRSGQLDSDITLKITDDQLDGSAKLVAHKLTLKSVDPGASAELAKHLGMSPDAALNMLRDADDNVRLTLPVKGDIRKPDFDLTDAINQALGKAVQTAALTYVKHALQPYGTLITLAQIAGKAASHVELQPIAFAPGDALPAADIEPYLAKLAALLAERPKLRIQICAVATEQDRQALATAKSESQARSAQGSDRPTTPAPVIADETLLALAEQRAANIKRELVKRGAAPERLFLCTPEIDKARDAAPRANLLL